ncbi:MAG: DUF4286 family protein [Tepidisphaera sp.]|nr:DUF4286 family protein [Tepidisphaera sp.]
MISSRPVSYAVTATLPNETMVGEYVAWLTGGHIQQVISGGAIRAEVVRITDPTSPLRVQARYVFPDRTALDRYVTQFAPALRAEGVAKWGDRVTFVREVGDIVGG